ncbi:MAG: iron uptake system protein EfeO [Solirubrobacterales bacterium]
MRGPAGRGGRAPRLAAVLAAGLLSALAAGCGSGGNSSGGARTLSVKLTDNGCEPAKAEVPAGPITFEVENAGTSKVSEFELLDEDRTILGEAENLAEGFSGSFSLTLEKGRYTMYCPGGERERGVLEVTAGPGSTTAKKEDRRAVATYRAYLERNADALVAAVKPLLAAIELGDVARARRLYVAARVPYERIEPVAESFGGLDPAIDAREGDVPAAEWSGFHPIERQLWVKANADGMAPVARRLLADTERLRSRVATVELQAGQIANGANELLGEVSASKITGEEERYSHTDLVDFEANLDGSKAAFESVRPMLAARAPALAFEIDELFDKAQRRLSAYGSGTDFVSYQTLTAANTRRLARSIDALAESVSQVPAEIVQ